MSWERSRSSRIKLVVAYDGHPFGGWQSQPGGNSVQDVLEAAVAKTAGAQIPVHGSGRTDAGVHALGQVAHFDAPGARLAPAQWVAALNSRLPGEIRVLRASRANASFHARFSATEKTYAYKIWNARVLPPHMLHRAWHVPQPLDAAAMRRAAEVFEGKHDFAAFAANRGKSSTRQSGGEDTVRTMLEVRMSRRGPACTLTYTATGFLYKMARLITGAIVRCGLGRMSIDELRAFLQLPQRLKCSHCAPADGLCLERVRYHSRSGNRRN